MNTDSRREKFQTDSYYQLVKKRKPATSVAPPTNRKTRKGMRRSVSPRETPLQLQCHPHCPSCPPQGREARVLRMPIPQGPACAACIHTCRDGTCAGARRCRVRPRVSGGDVCRASPGQAAAPILGCQLTGRLLRIC